MSLLSVITSCPSTFSLFPYTTLFRSERGVDLSRRSGPARSAPGRSALAVRSGAAGARAFFDEHRGEHRVCATGREPRGDRPRSEEHTSELQSPCNLVCRLLLEKKK